MACGLLACGGAPSGDATSPEPASSRRETPASSSPAEAPLHLLYLHGALVEGDDPRPVHPRHGVYDYPAIVAALTGEGFTVWSEQREAGADPGRWAERVVAEVRRLLAAGTPPDRIAVVGHSKGGAIALLASALVDVPGVRWVVLAGCFRSTPAALAPTGQLLSLRDTNDEIAVSCRPWLSDGPAEGQELELDTGLGHGLFYRPDPRWVDPLAAWLRGEQAAPSASEAPF